MTDWTDFDFKDTDETMRLNELASGMARAAHAAPRLDRSRSTKEYERWWGDCVLVFTLSLRGWRLSVRRQGKPPSLAQLVSFRRAFGVPDSAREETDSYRFPGGAWFIHRYCWQPVERLLEVREAAGLK